MTHQRDRRRIGWITGILALVRLLLWGDVFAASTPSARSTIAFCENLEPVVEAVTDGRPGRVPAAAHIAVAWWRAHDADTLYAAGMRKLLDHADSHRAPLAAGVAVGLCAVAMERCGEPRDVGLDVMRLDVTGMAAWLRSKGVVSESPVGAAEAAQRVSAKLRASHHEALAVRLEQEVAAALAVPARASGPTPAADRLLQTVDVVEEVLKKK